MAHKNSTKSRKELEALCAVFNAAISDPVPVEPTGKISKSKFVAGVQCLKRLYLQVHQPQLALISDQTKVVMEQGTQVGLLARNAFPGGVLVASDREHLAEGIRTTRELLKNREVPAIFEATFEYDGVLARVDVLKRNGLGHRLIEVKSSTEVKSHYAYDVGIQNHVVLGSGVQLNGTCLMHLSRDYVFDGRVESGVCKYDLSRLFTIAEIQPVSRGETTRLLNEQFRVLSQHYPPDAKIGRCCHDPVECEFYDVCHPALPDDHVGRLPIRNEKIEQLISRGITCIGQLPAAFSMFNLTVNERTRLNALQSRKTWLHPHLANELANIRYPLCFADFETIFPALPRYAGMRPYAHIPFQWSAHRLEHADAPLKHVEFLGEGSADPRRSFVQTLCGALKNTNCIAVYGTFESSRLKELADYFPEYAAEIENIRAKLWNVLAVVRRNIYHPAFEGSYSLKHVLPALVPEMSYRGFEVANGNQAGAAWSRMLDLATSSDKRDRLKAALLKYCCQDTFALVRIVDVLKAYASPATGGLHLVRKMAPAQAG